MKYIDIKVISVHLNSSKCRDNFQTNIVSITEIQKHIKLTDMLLETRLN